MKDNQYTASGFLIPQWIHSYKESKPHEESALTIWQSFLLNKATEVNMVQSCDNPHIKQEDGECCLLLWCEVVSVKLRKWSWESLAYLEVDANLRCLNIIHSRILGKILTAHHPTLSIVAGRVVISSSVSCWDDLKLCASKFSIDVKTDTMTFESLSVEQWYQ